MKTASARAPSAGALTLSATLLAALAFVLHGCGGSGGGGGGTPNPASLLDPISIVSINPAGRPGNGDSLDCGESCTNLSTTGRFVAFYSAASDLVAGDGNGVFDAFLRDMEAGTTVRVSVPSLADQGTLGTEGSAQSGNPSVSSSGRYVVFDSDASNLVLGDANGERDVFLHDTHTGETVRVSVPNLTDQGALGAESNGSSERPCISDDGRFVGFHSRATNLVVGDTIGARDVFVHDRQTGITERVSVHSNGAAGNQDSGNCSLSSDGTLIAFESYASNLVDGDTGPVDIFVRDRVANATTRVSVDSSGNEGTGGFGSFNPHMSGDGRYVTFWSSATNLVASDTNGESDIFLHDRATGETIIVSVPNLADQSTLGGEANNGAQYPAVSDDARYVAFSSNADNMVPGDTNGVYDIFVHDRQTGRTARVNVAVDGSEMTIGEASDWAGISGDGRYVNFQAADYSSGSDPNIVPGDSNLASDVYRAPNPLWEP